MSTVINTNVLALNAHRNLGNISGSQEKSSQRLSSGLRINSAADDAAGLAISEKMRAQIRGLDMATKNAQDAQSLIQTAEGGMQEIDNMIQRVRELTVQAANDTNEQDNSTTESSAQGDRQKMQDEIDQLTQEIDSMADRVEFNKKKVINGDFGKGTATEKQAVKDSLTALQGAKDTLAANWKSGGSIDFESLVADVRIQYDPVTTPADQAKLDAVNTSIETITNAYNSLMTATSEAEATAAKSTFTSALAALAPATNKAAADTGELAALQTAMAATLFDTVETAAIAVDDAKNAVKNSTAEGLYFQVGANANQSLQISINSVKTDMLGIGDGNGKSSINVLQSSGKDITNYLNTLDKALTYVTTERSKLGAEQNRLDYTMKSLQISSENLSAAESRIRDTDMAKEMMSYTKAGVLQQAATSMLAQANQAPQMVLKLLG